MLEQVRPVLGEIVADRARVPLKLFSPVIVMVDVPATPTLTVTVMVTPYAPRVVERNEQAGVTVRVDERIPGETGQETDRPVGVAAPVRLTFPLKLLTLVSMTGMVTPVCPRFRFAADVVTVKSPTGTVAEADRETFPGEPEPVTVTR